MGKQYNATFWHNGHVIGNGYGSSLAIALQRGARDIADEKHVTSNCVIENVNIELGAVGASQANKVRLPGMRQLAQWQLNTLGACIVHDLGDREEDAEAYAGARAVIAILAQTFGLDANEAMSTEEPKLHELCH